MFVMIFVETRFVFTFDIRNNKGRLQKLSVTASFTCSTGPRIINNFFYLLRTVNNIFIQLTPEKFKYR